MKKLILTSLIVLPIFLSAQKTIELPAPDKTGGKPLMETLNSRKSQRSFAPDLDLSKQQLSDLCWSAWGINREGEANRTAPSSYNKQEMLLYVALKTGLYLYNAEKHSLKQIADEDIRSACGAQDYVANASVNLVYVADLEKAGAEEPTKGTAENLQASYYNTGFMAQNVYLYCASENLATVVRSYILRKELRLLMKLKPYHHITLSQSVGFYD